MRIENEILRLYREGYSVSDIAAMTQCTTNYAYYVLKHEYKVV